VAAHDERYCSYCGGALLERTIEGRARRVCVRCNRVLYRHPALGAVAAVIRDAKILLIKRSIEPFRGHWTLPAGYLEIDEEPWEAARRETREETGLEIEQVELLGVLTNRDDHRRNGIVVAYLARPVGGELAAGDDAEDARFFEMDALPTDLGFLNNRRLLETLARRLASGGLS
jgi:ADP-ribose pyrophosphatase YjhB (NUDIX family)